MSYVFYGLQCLKKCRILITAFPVIIGADQQIRWGTYYLKLPIIKKGFFCYIRVFFPELGWALYLSVCGTEQLSEQILNEVLHTAYCTLHITASLKACQVSRWL